MLIGHLPVGYLTTKYLLKKYHKPLNSKWWFLTGLLASIAPDFDILYLMIFGSPGDSHRFYYTNYPILYLTLLLLSVIIYKIVKKTWLKFGIILVFTNMFVHLLLDTVFTGIKWLWPFYDRLIGIYNVNFTEGIFVENYFQHWYWYLEIALWVIAVSSVIISYRKGEIR